MKKIEIYTVNYCPYCQKAKALLDSKKVPYEEIDITENEDTYREKLAEHYKISGKVTVPQVIVDGERIGGFDTLEDLNTNGELNRILGVK